MSRCVSGPNLAALPFLRYAALAALLPTTMPRAPSREYRDLRLEARLTPRCSSRKLWFSFGLYSGTVQPLPSSLSLLSSLPCRGVGTMGYFEAALPAALALGLEVESIYYRFRFFMPMGELWRMAIIEYISHHICELACSKDLTSNVHQAQKLFNELFDLLLVRTPNLSSSIRFEDFAVAGSDLPVKLPKERSLLPFVTSPLYTNRTTACASHRSHHRHSRCFLRAYPIRLDVLIPSAPNPSIPHCPPSYKRCPIDLYSNTASSFISSWNDINRVFYSLSARVLPNLFSRSSSLLTTTSFKSQPSSKGKDRFIFDSCEFPLFVKSLPLTRRVIMTVHLSTFADLLQRFLRQLPCIQ